MLDIIVISLGKFNANCERVYSSSQVTRYEITMQGKTFTLEKQHVNPRSIKWKIKEHSDDVDINKLLQNLNDIKRQIDEYYGS